MLADIRTFLYCFSNEKGERDFKFLGISDQILGQIYFEESLLRDVFIQGK